MLAALSNDSESELVRLGDGVDTEAVDVKFSAHAAESDG